MNTVKTWDKFPKNVIHTKYIDMFQPKLDEAWKDLSLKFYELGVS